MDKLLIAGVDSIVGANLAAWLSGRRQVAGLCWSTSISVDGCTLETVRPTSSPAHWLSTLQPDWVVFCGPGADSCWNPRSACSPRVDWVAAASGWARAAREWNCEFTCLSSDAVFTGPWMFHRENGSGYCDSAQARALRALEQGVLEANPQALVVRTNAYGWSPLMGHPGLPERIVEALSSGGPLRLDCIRHATPILATDLADILDEARLQKLSGIHHVGGGERINPFRFACLLADQFGLPLSELEALDVNPEGRRDFGAGETSLQCRKIRKALGTPLPLIREGLARLHEQHVSGYRDRFTEAGELEPAVRAA